MPRQTRWPQTAAQVIYRSYPDQDLLPIDPPQPEETIGAFAQRAEEAGDTLFLFLCREANDEIDAAEYIARLDRAINDIEHVREAFLKRGRVCTTRPKSRLRTAPLASISATKSKTNKM
jgi:hypothetical protein